MKIRPLHDRLIVRRQEEERTTASGIVIPESASAEKPDQGVVEAVGNGKLLDDGSVRKLDVNVGDKVLFGKYAGQAVKVDGDELLVMKEEDVMGIIE
ncbi:co-chaperone GroES [Methylophilaceae bacterium]|jgi:chaperonin GroES|nr:co-chaperone GroES [Nitrosomonadales bacterium]MBT6232142.1 co-chaperone GroES [Nitrosomonadales bacterium]MBT6356084.1 co-chaperone GroES [Nitrosomonadales bacterium]MCH9771807.1 co-chaperone GroES [Betaproteobacteria bacterium]MDA9086928.1 co-chaperone GroES [Methylophilaceae bacterium]|tara:strand:- start:73 stop:363 length:291 start_codon:yes stop_codon:yes gene_type:complete